MKPIFIVPSGKSYIKEGAKFWLGRTIILMQKNWVPVSFPVVQNALKIFKKGR